MRPDIERYYARLRAGLRPIGDRERIVAQAIADGANSINDVIAATGFGRNRAHLTLLNLRGKGIVLPPSGSTQHGGLTIAPGYVVHKNEIFELRRVPHDSII